MYYSPEYIVILSAVIAWPAIIAVILRLIVRLKIRPSYIGADDWLAVAAVILMVSNNILLILSVALGTGGWMDASHAPVARVVAKAKIDYAELIIEKPLYGLMRLSVLYFFRRIFFTHQRFMLLSSIMIVATIAWTVAFTVPFVFSCGTDFSRNWTFGVPVQPPYCVDRNLLNLFFAITDPIGDLLVIIMPYPIIRKLHTGPQEKAGVIAIFMLGTFSSIAAVIRLGFTINAVTEDFGVGGSKHTNSGAAPAVWAMIEGSVGVLAASLPPLGVLIKMIPIPRVLSNLAQSISQKTSGSRKQSHGWIEIDLDTGNSKRRASEPDDSASSSASEAVRLPR